MTNRSIRLALIVVAANLAMFIADRTVAPGAAPLACVTSLTALMALHGREVVRPPVIAAAVALVGLTLVELLDTAGAVPVIRI